MEGSSPHGRFVQAAVVTAGMRLVRQTKLMKLVARAFARLAANRSLRE
ncbi:MAG: hypothetical protein AB8G99_04830 [Planctomycetaceae bacterium]